MRFEVLTDIFTDKKVLKEHIITEY